MTEQYSATARACSNIAFIKYWGNRDHDLRLPLNGSISMNLKGLETTTTVVFGEEIESDRLVLNGKPATGAALERVSKHLDYIRRLAGVSLCAAVESENNFPTGAGIASSASAFSALTAAACAALGLKLTEKELSIIARLGSGSASRSIPGGFVEWYAGEDHESSFAESIAPPDHWDLVDLVAIVSLEHKDVGSSGGHQLANTSSLQQSRIEDTPQRLQLCREAILTRDFDALTEVSEKDTLLMHSVMMTSEPALFYCLPPTLAVMQAVREWRNNGMPVFFTIDAGPNVHVITTGDQREEVERRLREIDGVITVLGATPGRGVEIAGQ
ncbi:MAG: diphosphomevalonate decarboxylase [Anaerolineae bacterium]|nr:diphosphomevalonate decarboxylase [Anaerolineae bacterium]